MTILPNQSGEIRLAANLWIRGDASRRQRKRRGGEGIAGIERRMAGSGTGTAKRGDSPDGESFGYAATLRAANERGGEREGPEPAEAAVRKREISESERFRADLGEKKREKEEFFGRVEKERRR